MRNSNSNSIISASRLNSADPRCDCGIRARRICFCSALLIEIRNVEMRYDLTVWWLVTYGRRASLRNMFQDIYQISTWTDGPRLVRGTVP